MFNVYVFLCFLKSVTQVGQLLHQFLNIVFCDCTTLPQNWLRCHPGQADPPSNNEIDFRRSRAICVFYFVNSGMSHAIRTSSVPGSWCLHASVNLMFNLYVAFMKSVTQVGQLLHKCLNIAFCDCTTLPQNWLRRHPGQADPPSNNEIDFRRSRAICVFYFVNFGMSHAIRTSSVPESWFLHASVNLSFNFYVAFLKSVTQARQLLHYFLNIAFCDCTTLSQNWLRCHPGQATFT